MKITTMSNLTVQRKAKRNLRPLCLFWSNYYIDRFNKTYHFNSSKTDQPMSSSLQESSTIVTKDKTYIKFEVSEYFMDNLVLWTIDDMQNFFLKFMSFQNLSQYKTDNHKTCLLEEF